MAPRIRLSLSKPLPTIREAHEEALEDASSNAQRSASTSRTPGPSGSAEPCSGEDDYIQSIRHLARPTCPGLPQAGRRAQDRKTLKALEDTSWSPALVGTRQEAPKCKLTDFISTAVPPGKVTAAPDGAETDVGRREDPLAQIYTGAGQLCSSAGPLSSKSSSRDDSPRCSGHPQAPGGEIHPRGTKGKAAEKLSLPRALGFPRLPSPRPAQKEMGGSEPRCLRKVGGTPSGSSHGQQGNVTAGDNGEVTPRAPCAAAAERPGSRGLSCSLGKQSRPSQAAGRDGGDERGCPRGDTSARGAGPARPRHPDGFRAAPKAAGQTWISAHRCSWKEAKLKACLLPAIAEV